MKNRILKIFISSIGAGLLISVGGFVYLSTKTASPYLAAFLFSIGLSSIIAFKLYLFTGKIGYVLENEKGYLIDLAVCYLGNVIAAILGGYLLTLTRVDLTAVSTALAQVKLGDNPLSVFILSVFCGMMIFLAVEVQKTELHPVWKLFGTIMPVMVFILSGFEHCIANVFYYSYANAWNVKTVLYVLLTTVGNGIGSIILWAIFKGAKNITDTSKKSE